MECDVLRNGASLKTTPAARTAGIKRKLVGGGVGRVRLEPAAAGPRPSVAAPAHGRLGLAHQPNTSALHADQTDPPFMSNMDEISYWIFTKRAPCLMNYDILNKKEVQINDIKLENVHSSSDESSPKKRKKRKLSILDDVSVPGKQQNMFFESPQPAHKPVLSSSKSDTLVSDIDFNIKKSSIQEKTRRTKSQRNSLTTVHKKNKLVTSTPKANNALRRSLRTQNTLNNSSPAKISCQTNFVFVNNEKQNCIETLKKTNHGTAKKVACNLNNKFDNNESNPKNVLNGQFEDMSDVSGFTANYIRSTKIQNTKTPRNLRSKNNRNLVKESQQNQNTDDDKMIVCVSKAMNTNNPTKTTILNCSTDSSQNIINLITTHDHEKGNRINKSTSLLKFMASKLPRNKKSEANLKNNSSQLNHNSTFDTSFNSNSSSRYPKRYKNGSRGDIAVNTIDSKTNHIIQCTPKKGSKQKVNKRPNLVLNLNMKEDPESTLCRTRSGRSVGIALHRPMDSVLVLSNCTEPSSKPAMNVMRATDHPPDDSPRRKRNSEVRRISHNKKSIEKCDQSLRHDSLRDRSGFAACFSDVEDNDEPLKSRKFFC